MAETNKKSTKMNDNTKDFDLLTMTTEIVSSYVSANELEASKLPAFIGSIYNALKNPQSVSTSTIQTTQEAAVPINKSITNDYLICLEDGKKLKMLRRYLRSNYNMSPDQYREKWGLPKDYPMVAPNYSKKRSSLAKDIGLGSKELKKRTQ